ncbi:MAG: DUF47 domain-containing protein [Firmicutes bacterium]|nr:DUF47 domain-containing protein [Bacillota bacterium]
MWPFGQKDYQLFRMFSESARVVTCAGEIVRDVVYNYKSLDERLAELEALENEGDKIIEQLMQKLNQSFVLPFDREDAYSMAQKLDSILDYITGIIDRMILYKPGVPNQVVRDLVETLLMAIKEQEKAFKLLESFESKRNQIIECCENIKRLEKKGDILYRQAMAELFQGVQEAMQIIKWKEIYEHIETTLDRCEDVSTLINGICIKYS